MLKITLLVLLLTGADLFAQNEALYDSTTTLLLSTGETTVSRVQLDTGFMVKLNNPEAKLISFSMIYAFANEEDSGLQQILFKGNKVFIDKKFQPIFLFKSPPVKLYNI